MKHSSPIEVVGECLKCPAEGFQHTGPDAPEHWVRSRLALWCHLNVVHQLDLPAVRQPNVALVDEIFALEGESVQHRLHKYDRPRRVPTGSETPNVQTAAVSAASGAPSQPCQPSALFLPARPILSVYPFPREDQQPRAQTSAAPSPSRSEPTRLLFIRPVLRLRPFRPRGGTLSDDGPHLHPNPSISVIPLVCL